MPLKIRRGKSRAAQGSRGVPLPGGGGSLDPSQGGVLQGVRSPAGPVPNVGSAFPLNHICPFYSLCFHGGTSASLPLASASSSSPNARWRAGKSGAAGWLGAAVISLIKKPRLTKWGGETERGRRRCGESPGRVAPAVRCRPPSGRARGVLLAREGRVPPRCQGGTAPSRVPRQHRGRAAVLRQQSVPLQAW